MQDPPLRPKTARELGIMCGFPPPPEKRPTLANWDMPPFNRWAFQNVRSLIPTVDVYRGVAPVRELTTELQDFSRVSFLASDGQSKTISQFLVDSYTDGVLVLHRGRVVSELYFNDMRPETPHLSQSVSKSIVGTLAGILHGKGLIDLHAPLASVVPELAHCGYADATLHHVLDMQSGVRFTEDYGAAHSDMTRIDIASGWRPPYPGETVPTIRDVILSLPKIREHGGIFEYRSIETDVVAWVLERSAHKPLADLLSQEIWQKIGTERDAYFTVDSAGTALADGGFNATLRDYARFGKLLLDGGKIDSEQIVPEAWVDSFGSGEPSKFGPPYSDVSPHGAYRNQWWVNDVAYGDFMARGVFGQMIYVDRAGDFLVVKLSTWPDYVIPSFTIDSLRAAAAIRAELTAGG